MLKDYPLEQLIEPLLAWYARHARVLPWREDHSPYRVWVSEIMLQQTRVETVKPYFERFVAELPNVRALAECDSARLLKLWEGLGYYNRVRNMQEAAQTLMREYGGELPADYEKLLSLKGIGHYTAGAIASIAFGIPVPAVDGNVFRILMRVSDDSSDITKPSVRTMTEQILLPHIPGDRAGGLAQAMMELGATVCLPNGEPKCARCPWEPFCLSRARGTYAVLPVKGKPAPRRIEQKTVLIIRDGARILLHLRKKQGLLAGMYEFPNIPGHVTEEEALQFAEGLSFTPLKIEPLEPARHVFSHIEWHMNGYLIRIAEPDGGEREADSRMAADGGYVFADIRAAEDRYAIPAAFSSYTRYLHIRLGKEKFE